MYDKKNLAKFPRLGELAPGNRAKCGPTGFSPGAGDYHAARVNMLVRVRRNQTST